MFDKNNFKEKFRQWIEAYPYASFNEAKAFCEKLLPQEAREEYAWLEEQSLAWFLWKKESQIKLNLNLIYEKEDYEQYQETERKLI